MFSLHLTYYSLILLSLFTLCLLLRNRLFFIFSIIAIVEGRGLAKGEIGMAALDLRGSELTLLQVNYWQLKHLIHYISQVVLSDSYK